MFATTTQVASQPAPRCSLVGSASLIDMEILYIAWFDAYIDIPIICTQNSMHARSSNVDQMIFEMFFKMLFEMFFVER
jgi:hypothetical protein